MTDRELLELAAKAVGIATYWTKDGQKLFRREGGIQKPWNPLTNDGDALRLAVKLGMDIYSGSHTVVAEILSDYDGPPIIGKVFIESDPLIATRRAIVLAAAEVGKEKSDDLPNKNRIVELEQLMAWNKARIAELRGVLKQYYLMAKGKK